MYKDKMLNWLIRYKSKLIPAVIVVAVLVVAFFMGDNPDDGRSVNSSGNVTANEEELLKKDKEFKDILQADTSSDNKYNNSLNSDGNGADSENQTDNNQSVSPEPAAVNTDNEADKNSTYSSEQISDKEDTSLTQQQTEHNSSDNQKTGQDQSAAGQQETPDIPQPEQQPETPKTQQSSQNENNQSGQNTDKEKLTCTFSISCATILDNMSKLDKDKKDLVPEDGWILTPTTVEFKQGETIFDLLKRICMSRKLHMESSWTPLYNSAYIEGINNLYQFDCGSLSGWMYCVNGEFYNYGCSKAVINNGDVVEWVYTCDLGKDVQK